MGCVYDLLDVGLGLSMYYFLSLKVNHREASIFSQNR